MNISINILTDHVLLHGRTIRAKKEGQNYAIRVMDGRNPLAQTKGCKSPIYMDICRMEKHPGSGMWCLNGHDHRMKKNQYGFSKLPDAFKWINDNGFIIFWPKIKNKELSSNNGKVKP